MHQLQIEVCIHVEFPVLVHVRYDRHTQPIAAFAAPFCAHRQIPAFALRLFATVQPEQLQLFGVHENLTQVLHFVVCVSISE